MSDISDLADRILYEVKAEEYISHTVFDDPNYRADHGIKGQRWGVRRYQNEDGTLTKSGRARRELYGETKNGEKITITENADGKLSSFLYRHSSKVRELSDKSFISSIKDSNGNKVGDLQLFDEGNNSLNVNWIGVNNKSRGNGYAQAAIKSTIDYAKKNGYKQVTLEVPGDSPDARHVYEKLGFKAIEQISDEDDVWGGLTSMYLDLENSK